MQDQPPTRAWWHRFHFCLNVRALMVVVLILGGVFGWIAHLARLARVQRDAVAAVSKAHGSVLYDWQMQGDEVRVNPDTNTTENEVPRVPKWLVDRLGVEYFGDVAQVSFWFDHIGG